MKIRVWHVGIATLVIEFGPIRIITDPSLDEPGTLYHHGFFAFSKKESSPRYIEKIRNIDLALLSHGQHKDNLDYSGKELLNEISRVITTNHTAKKLNNGIGLATNERFLFKKEGVELEISAITAQHGVFPVHYFAGPVTGFVLRKPKSKNLIYISGDTVYRKEIADQVNRYGSVKLFIPHLGEAQFNYLTGKLRYTMNKVDLEQYLTKLSPENIYPVHNNGWSHFKQINLSELNNYKERFIRSTHYEIEI